jgi:catechol 2,3-dioxygenase-like lactoylglutathione lyase family enzyme
MITGIHGILFSSDPAATRACLRDAFGWDHVDAHDGWLIFRLPPAELGVHPAEQGGQHQLYLMCDDLGTTMAELREKGVEFEGEPRGDRGVGTFITALLPGEVRISLYQPEHLTAI